MNCPRCGRENPSGSSFCGGCGASLTGERPTDREAGVQVPPKTSGMAVAALILAILGFLCILPVVGVLLGLILGIMALLGIQRSGGQLQGQGLAIAAIVVSGLWLMFVSILAAILIPVFAGAR